ncbi:hypothetical protein HDV05_006250 [Chytridiales sp. JEL 0842]|nr:hypothetical protein HDV05_006250 [Chytridiales sp. JEL 0842]
MLKKVSVGLALLLIALNARSLPLIYHLRLLYRIAASQIRYKQKLLTYPSTSGKRNPSEIWNTCVLKERVTVDDMDWNMHMNNSSYNLHLDFARTDHIVSSFGFLTAANYRFANGGVSMFFRREILPFQAYEIRSRLLSFDNKWFYVEHRFVTRDKKKGEVLMALGISKQVVKEKKTPKTVPFDKFLEIAGYGVSDDPVAAEQREKRRLEGWAVVQGFMLYESSFDGFVVKHTI